MCRLEVCGYTRTREYGSGRVDALRVHHTITNIACWNLRSKIKKLFIWWYRCYMSWKPRCWNRKYNTNKTPQRYCSFVEILHSLWTKVLGQTDMVPLRCSIFAPGVQRTRQFEIEQHGTQTTYSTTWHERNGGITGGQSTRRSAKKTEAQSSVVTVVGLFMTPETVGADSVASWLSAHCLSRLRLNLQLHSIDLVRTCHISSFCTVAWQLARFQLTQRIARSLGDSWASCFLTAMKSQILPQLLMRSMLIPLQISTLRTGMTHLWLSGSRIALASQNWRSSLEVSIFDSGIAEQAKERSVQLDTWWLTWP